MIQANKIKAIRYGALKEPGDRKRKIPTGMFDPHMTWMISGKTGSGKSTALIQMLKAFLLLMRWQMFLIVMLMD